ncbi:hypothetical protein EDD18DRAFT_1465616 [Armillaria luteobubalina]|uniref:DUF6535 domain-containing protein n=1 Tax=Armillaria luteobubalina TaxID=153913 RepID=A0AA39PYQ5_9AGAR|nr:hypothetical protein EDD18DRAFT_1465616 [Armillaria luteobubalina]
MSTREIDRTSNLDQKQDRASVHEDTEADLQGIGVGGEHPQNLAEQEVEPDEAAGGQDEDDAPASAPVPAANAAGAKTVFGMKRANPTVKRGNDMYDYEKKYPEDAIYEETTPNARVWRVHEDESKKHDDIMVEEFRDNVDVLLVFAGLFSAIITTFVVQTSQSLQVDNTAMLASLLYESILLQRAIANGSSVNSITPSPLNPTITFVPATSDVWVNGLWFTSLFLSLTTALVAVLVKQWLHHYIALPSGTPRDRSLTRQFRYAGLQKWHVPAIIGLLPVVMHLALAIFLVGLVIFLQPLQQALSWVICAGTSLVYIAYVVATILPIIFPQCPYQTPLCNLIYISFHCIVPQVTWYHKQLFLSLYRQRDFKTMFCYLPCIQARQQLSMAMIESNFVYHTSTDLAPEALHWLFSVSFNPTVQSIVIQSTGGLPMASEEKYKALWCGAMEFSHTVLLWSHLGFETATGQEPVPGMGPDLERLLRFYDGFQVKDDFKISSNIDSFEQDVAISSCNALIVKDGATIVSPDAFFINILSGSTGASKLPPHSWLLLVQRAAEWGAFETLDPVKDDHTNMFPLYLCSAILQSFHILPKDLTQGFNSPIVLNFKDALPYFLNKVCHNVLSMFSEFSTHPSLSDPSLHQSLKLIVAAIKFLLHRSSLPESTMSHTIIFQSLTAVIHKIRDEEYSSQEATALIVALEDIIAVCLSPLHNIESDWIDLYYDTIETYYWLTIVAPSACSMSGLQSIVDFMISHWDQIKDNSYRFNIKCGIFTNLLEKHIPIAFTMFHESQWLLFLGSHTFHKASHAMISAYVAGILVMQQESDRTMDAKSLQQHIDYLYNPPNLFTTCTILATHGCWQDQTAIDRDITALAQLHPQDTAWEECHRKLDDLVQSKDGEFFSKQLILQKSGESWGYFPLCENHIEAGKENIRYAIHVLDVFFNDRGHTNDTMVTPDSSSEWYLIDCIHHFFQQWFSQKHDGEPEQGQQV